MHSALPCAATNKLHPLRCSHDKIEYNTPMATRTTNVNHSDLPCSCSSLDQYVDGLCPGCTEAADRDADLKEHVDAQAAREPHPFPAEMIEDAFEGDDVSAPRSAFTQRTIEWYRAHRG